MDELSAEKSLMDFYAQFIGHKAWTRDFFEPIEQFYLDAQNPSN